MRTVTGSEAAAVAPPGCFQACRPRGDPERDAARRAGCRRGSV